MACIRQIEFLVFWGFGFFRCKSLPHACGTRVGYAHHHPILSSQRMMSRSTREQNAGVVDRDDDVPVGHAWVSSSSTGELSLSRGVSTGTGFPRNRPVVRPRPCPIKIVLVGKHWQMISTVTTVQTHWPVSPPQSNIDN